MLGVSEHLEQRGYAWFRGALSASELAKISAYCAFDKGAGSRPDPAPPLLKQLRPGSRLGDLVSRAKPGARPVRLVAFNKTPASNWGVPWHQDRVIAVGSKHDVPGFSHWGRKNECWHVEPPTNLLENMFFVRVHFDHESSANGALEVAVGSHRFGNVRSIEAQSKATHCKVLTCEAKPGDVLILHALILHRSSTAHTPSNRRTLRIDYADFELPSPLKWALTET